jgi:ribosomal protein L11 methyltransferase
VPGASVVDLGCGSGVLAIAAARLGAGSVLAEDIDPVALAVTAENAKRNGVRFGLVDRHLVDWPTDLLVANIGAEALIGFAQLVVSELVVLSGLLSDRSDDVAAAYVALGYDEVERAGEGGWAALVLRRRAVIA